VTARTFFVEVAMWREALLQRLGVSFHAQSPVLGMLPEVASELEFLYGDPLANCAAFYV